MTDQAYPDALPPQHRLHWYVLERVLGQGGFGITYLARDTNLDQLVAVKEYLPGEVATRRPDGTVRARTDAQRERYRWGLDRFIREARTLARFDHPNIVRVHSVFELNDTAYMVMRFEAGTNLGAHLDHCGILPEDELLAILLPVLDGLELVHNAGFIHRDIKPDNIHIRDDGTPVLLDFGSARHALGKARTLTILIAPGYAPFEQYYANSESQGPWTDIYGLGATCYRAIAGTAPIDSIARSKGILGSTREALVPAKVIGKGRYSDRLLSAIDHALAFAEKDRPQSIAEWRGEIIGEGVSADAPRTPSDSAAALTPVSAAAAGPDQRSAAAGTAAAARAGSASGVRMPLFWGIFGAIAGAVAIAIFLRVSAPDRGAETAAADKQRQAQEAEQGRIAEAIEAQKQALDSDRKRQAQEAEKRQIAEEAEKQRAEDAEKKRLAQESERRRQAMEAEKKRKAEAERIADQKRKPDAVLPLRPEAPPDATGPAKAAESAGKPQVQDLLARATEAEARGDFAEARKVLSELATAGNPAAQARLADGYARGQGVPVSEFQAYIWYSLSVRCGNASAASSQVSMARRLQPAQIAQADGVLAGMKICK
jgi:hypothetical protein